MTTLFTSVFAALFSCSSCQDVFLPAAQQASCSGHVYYGRASGDSAEGLRGEDCDTVDHCCQACISEPLCQTWTFDAVKAKCFLKSRLVGELHDDRHCTTGVLPASPPYQPPYPTPADSKNVLFIVVDDLRPNLGAYNFSQVHTPHIDALAEGGLLFTRAYAQYSFCSPSRNSFLSGRNPDTTGVWEFVDHFREGDGASWTSFPEYFKQHGYLVLGSGKIYHSSNKEHNVGLPKNDYPRSWSPEYPYGFLNAEAEYNCSNPEVPDEKGAWCAAALSRDDSVLRDQRIRDSCKDQLRLAAADPAGRPWFVACGFIKPHAPFHFPQEFLDVVPDWHHIPLADYSSVPVGMPDVAWHFPADGLATVSTHKDVFNDTCNETRARTYRRAYYAAVSYQDYNIGVVLAELERLGIDKDTVVVLMGDHGYQLGEHATWSKMTNFELGTRIPLIVRAPWKVHSLGQKTDVLAEAVDVYPTVAILAGLPPPWQRGEQLNGTDLTAAFQDPIGTAGLKEAAYSQFAKVDTFDVSPTFTRNQTKFMGYTVRDTDWRYTAWFGFDPIVLRPNVSDVVGRELYDHRADSGLWLDFPGENRNLVDEDKFSKIGLELHDKVLQYIQL